MKTVRTSAFETNSSSTHALSIRCPGSTAPIDLNIIPTDGIISVTVSQGDGSSMLNNPKDKLAHLLTYAMLMTNIEWLTSIEKVCKEHTGASHIFLTSSTYNYDKKCYEIVDVNFENSDKIFGYSNLKKDGVFGDTEKDDVVGEVFCYCTRDGYTEDFINTIETILKDENKIRAFIFSSSDFVEIETYFDG